MDHHGFFIALNGGLRHAVRNEQFDQRPAVIADVSNLVIHWKEEKKLMRVPTPAI